MKDKATDHMTLQYTGKWTFLIKKSLIKFAADNISIFLLHFKKSSKALYLILIVTYIFLPHASGHFCRLFINLANSLDALLVLIWIQTI